MAADERRIEHKRTRARERAALAHERFDLPKRERPMERWDVWSWD